MELDILGKFSITRFWSEIEPDSNRVPKGWIFYM